MVASFRVVDTISKVLVVARFDVKIVRVVNDNNSAVVPFVGKTVQVVNVNRVVVHFDVKTVHQAVVGMTTIVMQVVVVNDRVAVVPLEWLVLVNDPV
jgi:hypothetical protein